MLTTLNYKMHRLNTVKIWFYILPTVLKASCIVNIWELFLHAIFKHVLLNLMQIARHNYSRVSFIRLRRTIRCKRELFRIHVVNFHRVSDPFSTTPDDYNMLIFSIWNSCTTPTFVFQSIGYKNCDIQRG